MRHLQLALVILNVLMSVAFIAVAVVYILGRVGVL